MRGHLTRLLGVLLFTASIVRAEDAATTEVPAAGEDGAQPVALVNGEAVELEDLERVLSSLHSGQGARQRGAFDLDRLLTQVVDDVLLAQEARALGMHEEEPIPSQLQRMATRLAVERLEREEVRDKVIVTDEEIRSTFESQYATASFRILTVDERQTAEELRRRLAEGAEFAVLAGEHSTDQYRNRGGLAQGMSRINLPNEIGDAIFAAEPGTVLGPVRTGLGYALLEVQETRPADEEGFAEVEPEIRRLLLGRNAALLRRDLGREVRDLYEVERFPAAIDSVTCERLPDGRLQATAADPAAVVARVAGHEILAEEFAWALQRRWKGVRNEEAAVAAKPLVLGKLISGELLKAEALRRGYHRAPEVKREVQAHEREMLVVRYLQETVDSGVEVSEEEIEAYYQEHRENYHRAPRLHLGQITVALLEEAERLAGLLRAGADLAWLARQHSIDGFKDSGGVKGWVTPFPGVDWLQDQLMTAQPGDVLGPIGVEGNYIVTLVTAREEQGIFTLEEMTPRVRAVLFQQKRLQATQRLIERLRERSEIQIFEDVVAALNISGERQEPAAPPGHGG